ncbi:hypothetical protein [Clostridium polynesiense]|uniref:hypothetical protein n=1 Tax=Clostridium polynesiense TaxID=1325933 RepID=UPI00058D5751|nr:hypothetical protein [Clostridium polynesiense]
MFVDLNRRLEEAVSIKREADKLKGKINALEETIYRRKQLLTVLKEDMNNELEDVNSLNKISITSLLYSIILKKDEKLKKEEREYIEAKSKVEDCTREIEELEREKERLEVEMKNYGDFNKVYQELFKEKEEFIKRNSTEGNKNILKLSEEISNKSAYIKELMEAIKEGEALVFSMENLINSLESAKKWGLIDMAGGGMISTHIKHENLDKSREYIDSVKSNLGRFERELQDVSKEEINIDLGVFISFADYFFDGFFVDWYIQGSINDVLSNAYNLKYKIEDIINNLEKNLGETHINLESLKKKRVSYIEESEI